MPEYIDRGKLPVKQIPVGGPMMPRIISVVYADDIAAAPAADVVEVVHAHIVTNWLGDCRCSNCGEYADCAKPYCASCGARLDEPEQREE